MSQNENPILYIEELQRFPLRRRREPVPGSIVVYRGRNGALTVPQGGYTAAELLWHGPQVAYEIDLSRHAANFICETGEGCFDVSISWVVTDPVAVVAARLTDPFDVATEAVQTRLQAIADLPIELALVEGIRVTAHLAFRLPGDPG